MFVKIASLALLAMAQAVPVVYQDYGHAPAVYSQPLLQKAIYQPAPVVHAAPSYIHAAPVLQKQILTKVVEPEPVDPNPKYDFSYGVSDPHTGDSKNAEEHLENGVIHGSYSLVEPDGHIRKVTYTADHVNGFNAVVERTGGAPVAKVIAAPVAKVVAAAPAYAFAGHHY